MLGKDLLWEEFAFWCWHYRPEICLAFLTVFRYTDRHKCLVSGVLRSNNVFKFENVGYLLVSKMRCCTC